MNATTAPAIDRSTRLLALLLLVAAAAHVPGTAHHAAEAPYTAVAFVAFTTACLVLLLALASGPSPLVHAAAALLCGSAVAAYALSRLVALPGMEHDVAHWLDPLGVVSVVAESLVVATVVLRARRG